MSRGPTESAHPESNDTVIKNGDKIIRKFSSYKYQMTTTSRGRVFVPNYKERESTLAYLRELLVEPFINVVQDIIAFISNGEFETPLEFTNARDLLLKRVQKIQSEPALRNQNNETNSLRPVDERILYAIRQALQTQVGQALIQMVAAESGTTPVDVARLIVKLPNSDGLERQILELQTENERLQRESERSRHSFIGANDAFKTAVDKLSAVRKERDELRARTKPENRTFPEELLKGPLSLLGMTPSDVMVIFNNTKVLRDLEKFIRALQLDVARRLHPDVLNSPLKVLPDGPEKRFVVAVNSERFKLSGQAIQEIVAQVVPQNSSHGTNQVSDEWQYTRKPSIDPDLLK